MDRVLLINHYKDYYNLIDRFHKFFYYFLFDSELLIDEMDLPQATFHITKRLFVTKNRFVPNLTQTFSLKVENCFVIHVQI